MNLAPSSPRRPPATGLSSGKFYSFQLRALDDVSPGNVSAWVKSALLPAKPTGLTATPGNTNVTLAWTDPNNPTIHNWQYQQDSGDWKDAAVGVTLGSSTLTFRPGILATLGSSILTFTTQNWNDYQTVTVKLASQPTGTTTVTFNRTGVEFSPATLNFNAQNWNTTQNVQVRLKTAPQQDTDVSLAAPAHLVASPQKWNVYQTVPVKLASAPAAPVTVTFNATNLDFSPASLTFTPQNWNINRNVQVKMKTQPSTTATVDMTTTYSVPWDGSTTLTLTGLTNSSAYTFKVRAVNIGGIGPESDATASTSPTTAPAIPTGFTATPGVAQATLKWADPGDTAITAYEYRQTEPAGGLTVFANNREVDLSWNSPADTSNIAKWQFRAERDGQIAGFWADIPGSVASTKRFTATSESGGVLLGNDLKYNFRVRAATTTTTSGGLTARGDYTRVDLFWTKFSDSDVNNIHKWQYRYKSDGSYGPWTQACVAVGGPNQIAECKNRISLSTSRLTNGTAYTFQVRALDSSDNRIGSVLGEVTMTPIAAAKPLGPVTATPSSSGGWTNIPNSGDDTTSATS